MTIPDPPWKQKTRPCPFFSQGRCLFADSCNFLHDVKVKARPSDIVTAVGLVPGIMFTHSPTESHASVPSPTSTPGRVRSPARSPRLSSLLLALGDVIQPEEDEGIVEDDEISSPTEADASPDFANIPGIFGEASRRRSGSSSRHSQSPHVPRRDSDVETEAATAVAHELALTALPGAPSTPERRSSLQSLGTGGLLSPIEVTMAAPAFWPLGQLESSPQREDSVDSGFAEWTGPAPLALSPPRSPSARRYSTLDLLSSPFGTPARILSPSFPPNQASGWPSSPRAHPAQVDDPGVERGAQLEAMEPEELDSPSTHAAESERQRRATLASQASTQSEPDVEQTVRPVPAPLAQEVPASVDVPPVPVPRGRGPLGMKSVLSELRKGIQLVKDDVGQVATIRPSSMAIELARSAYLSHEPSESALEEVLEEGPEEDLRSEGPSSPLVFAGSSAKPPSTSSLPHQSPSPPYPESSTVPLSPLASPVELVYASLDSSPPSLSPPQRSTPSRPISSTVPSPDEHVRTASTSSSSRQKLSPSPTSSTVPFPSLNSPVEPVNTPSLVSPQLVTSSEVGFQSRPTSLSVPFPSLESPAEPVQTPSGSFSRPGTPHHTPSSRPTTLTVPPSSTDSPVQSSPASSSRPVTPSEQRLLSPPTSLTAPFPPLESQVESPFEAVHTSSSSFSPPVTHPHQTPSSRPTSSIVPVSLADSPVNTPLASSSRPVTPPRQTHLTSPLLLDSTLVTLEESLGDLAASKLLQDDDEVESSTPLRDPRSVDTGSAARPDTSIDLSNPPRSASPSVSLGSPFLPYDRSPSAFSSRSSLADVVNDQRESRPSSRKVPFGFRHSTNSRSRDSSASSRQTSGSQSSTRRRPPALSNLRTSLLSSRASDSPVSSASSSAFGKLKPLRLSVIVDSASGLSSSGITPSLTNASTAISQTPTSPSVSSEYSIPRNALLSSARSSDIPDHVRNTPDIDRHPHPHSLKHDSDSYPTVPHSAPITTSTASNTRASWQSRSHTSLQSFPQQHHSSVIFETDGYEPGAAESEGEVHEEVWTLDTTRDEGAPEVLQGEESSQEAQEAQEVHHIAPYDEILELPQDEGPRHFPQDEGPLLFTQEEQIRGLPEESEEDYIGPGIDDTVRAPDALPPPVTRTSIIPSSFPEAVHALATPRPTLLFAIASDNVDEVRRVLESGEAGPNDDVGPQSALAFTLTAEGLKHRMDIVKLLLAHGANPKDLTSRAGTPVKSQGQAGSTEDAAPAAAGILADVDPATRYYVARADAPQGRKASALIHRSFFRPLTKMRYALIGQDRALEQLYRVLSMPTNAPIVVLLCGPSGHGKSLLARKFGSLLDVPTHTVNMTTLRSTHDIWRSYSMSPYEEPSDSTLSDFLIENQGKRCVVVLDEIEKVEDEKYLSSLLMPWELGRCSFEAGQRHVDVSKVIWLGTSNIGHDLVFEHQAARRNPEEAMSREEYLELIGMLRPRVSDRLGPSLLSRVTTVLPFVPFTVDERMAIATEAFFSLAEDAAQSLPPSTVENLVQNALRSYAPTEGARSLYRAVSTELLEML